MILYLKNFLKENLSYNNFLIIKKIYDLFLNRNTDQRRFWNGGEIESNFENAFLKILGKQLKQKKITIKNQTLNCLKVKKNIIFEKIQNKNTLLNLSFFFKGANKKNKLFIKNNKTIFKTFSLDSNKIKNFQFNLRSINKNLSVENKSNSDLFIAFNDGVRIEAKPINYIVIILDSLNSDLLYKNLNKMKYTKKFFKTSDHYCNFFTNAEWTVPSLTSIITGLHPSKHCFTDLKSSHNFDFNNYNDNIFSYYKKNNFKVHLLTRSKGHNPHFNFDINLDSFFYYPYIIGNESFDKKIIKNTCDLLRKNSRYNNFFLIHLISTHPPYNNSKTNLASSELLTEFKSFYKKKGETKALDEFTEEGKKTLLKRLKFTLSDVDNNLNKLYCFLIKNNFLGNTTVAVTSDHGPSILANEDSFLFHRDRSQIPLLIKRPLSKKRKIYRFESLHNLKNILEDKKVHSINCVDNYSISESIFNNKYECGIYYKKYTFLYKCEVNQKLKKIFLNKLNNKKILFCRKKIFKKKYLNFFMSILVNHLKTSKYRIIN
jgi:hypothetical protein